MLIAAILTPWLFWPVLALLLAPVAYGLVREQWGALRRLRSERGHGEISGPIALVLLIGIFMWSWPDACDARLDTIEDRITALETPVSETSSTEVAPEEAPQ